MKQYHNENNRITSETLQQMANAITIRALKTTLAKSANPTIEKLLFDAIAFAQDPHGAHGGDGANLVQDTALYLWQYNGKTLDDTTTDGQTDKDGNPITILRGAFRNIRAIIYGHEQRQYKQVYLEDYENENGVLAVPCMWDMPTYTDYTTAKRIIDSLHLTATQYQILKLRLQGLSMEQCAKVKGCSKKNVHKIIEQIRTKYTNLYGEIAIPVLAKITE